jgi:hypothetical protein
MHRVEAKEEEGMMDRAIFRAVCVAGALALTVSSAAAQVVGGGTVSGTDKLKVKGCGRGKAPATLTFTLLGNGSATKVSR